MYYIYINIDIITRRRNTKRIVGGDKEIINISKCYIEVYYGITFYIIKN